MKTLLEKCFNCAGASDSGLWLWNLQKELFRSKLEPHYYLICGFLVKDPQKAYKIPKPPLYPILQGKSDHKSFSYQVVEHKMINWA